MPGTFGVLTPKSTGGNDEADQIAGSIGTAEACGAFVKAQGIPTFEAMTVLE